MCGGAISSKRNLLLAYFALLLASAVFLFRGPFRARTAYLNDFASPYVSTRLWLNHQNPYDTTLFFPTWHAAGAPQTAPGNPSGWHPVYPPPTLVVLIPLAILPWTAAVHTLLFLSATAYIVALIQFATLLPGTWRTPKRLLFLAFGLAFAPAQSSLHVSNVACLSASLLFLALYRLLAKHREPDLLAAICITVSICLKPTIGLLILPWLLLRARRTLIATLSASALITAIALYPLLQLGAIWFTSLKQNLTFLSTNGGATDLSTLNNNRFDRIDLQQPLFALTHSRTAASLLSGLIAAVLLILWFYIQREHRSDHQTDYQLLSISTLLVIGLLPVYQRYYVAILLLPAILWAFSNLATKAARWLLVLSAIFLVNTEALFRTAHIDDAVGRYLSTFTEAILGPHLCWLILALTGILLATLYKNPSTSTN
jgi:hypothetical protein